MYGLSNDPVNHLLCVHAADKLRSYQANKLAVVHAIERNWIPAEDDPGVPEFLDALRQHLARTEHHEIDPFLLRYGLTIPGTQRGIDPPLLVLQDDRGGFSPRRQTEAREQLLRLGQVLSIGRIFFSDLDADTEKAILQLAKLCGLLPVADDAAMLAHFKQLDDVQAQQLAAKALGCLDIDDKWLQQIGIQILQHLACYRDRGLTASTCDDLVRRGIFWPSSLFRDACEPVADGLIKLVDERPNQSDRNHLLLALAWTRSESALSAFSNWSQHAPLWAASLGAPLESFLPSAGWCLDEAGIRRDIISMMCFRLLPSSRSDRIKIVCREALRDKCPSCGGPQAILFDFSECGDHVLTGILIDAPRRVLCCLHCSCYQTVYSRYQPDGGTHWLSPVEKSSFPNEEDFDREPCYQRVEPSPISPFACAEPFDFGDASTVGGIPSWLQYAAFPRCIECGQFMTFLAQHDNGPLGEEGIYYAFFCADCRVAAVTYQQT